MVTDSGCVSVFPDFRFLVDIYHLIMFLNITTQFANVYKDHFFHFSEFKHKTNKLFYFLEIKVKIRVD